MYILYIHLHVSKKGLQMHKLIANSHKNTATCSLLRLMSICISGVNDNLSSATIARYAWRISCDIKIVHEYILIGQNSNCKTECLQAVL